LYEVAPEAFYKMPGKARVTVLVAVKAVGRLSVSLDDRVLVVILDDNAD
jgi:hypothetical protein